MRARGAGFHIVYACNADAGPALDAIPYFCALTGGGNCPARCAVRSPNASDHLVGMTTIREQEIVVVTLAAYNLR